MNQILRLTLVWLSLLSSLCAVATAPSYTINVIKVANDEEPDKNKETPRRHRTPSAPIECVITPEGIEIMDASVTVSDIISFEIWDADSESCLVYCACELDFLAALFSMSGEFQIRLVFADFELMGEIIL